MTEHVSLNERDNWFARVAQTMHVKSRRRRAVLLTSAFLVLAPVYYGLSCGRVVINGSDSLHANAFVMVTWPKWVVPGAIVAFEMPEPLLAGLGLEKGQAVYVKRVLGTAGDAIELTDAGVCVNDRCLPQYPRKNGRPLSMYVGTQVPDGTVFVAGDSPSSFDSRYALIGPRPLEDVLAVGVPIGLPDWRSLRALLDRGG